MKLTRAQIKESLKSVPMEQILLGVHSAKQTNLTAKQIRFAESVARGESKAGAYRKAYNTKASPGHQSRKGQELAKREAIGRQVEAFQAAFEAQRYATPVHLRAMTIHQLTKNALNEDFPPAQRVKCLELLGKITEVSLFTERREIVHISDPEEIKEKLMASLRLAMGSDIVDVEATDGDDLLAELEGSYAPTGEDLAPEILADPIEAQPDADPTHPPPPSADSTEGSKYT
jgi:hypothetical protein